VKAVTPVDLIEITRKDFKRYIATSPSAMENLKLVDANRKLNRAKRLLRLQTGLKTHILKQGDVIYNQGDTGNSMFIVDDKEGGELHVVVDGHTCMSLTAGEVFGEAALLFKRPRKSTVRCSSASCKVHEMRNADFIGLVESTPHMAACLRNMSRRREFQKALSLTTRSQFRTSDLRGAFNALDLNKNGLLGLTELTMALRRIDPNLPDEEIMEYMKLLDLNENGQCDFQEFERIFSANNKSSSMYWDGNRPR